MVATLDSLAHTARPVFFEIDSEEFPYAGRGTALLTRLRDTVYVVGLEHVIGGPVDDLRIYPDDRSDVSIPFDRMHAVARPTPADEDFAQLKVMRVDTHELMTTLVPLDIECARRTWRPPRRGEDLVIYGYPDQLRGIDYEALRLRYQQAEMTGHFLGPSLSSHCSEFELVLPPGINDLSGFSGSPVFGVSGVGGRSDVRFRGVMTRGVADAKHGHFINAEVVFEIFDRIEAGLTSS